MGNQIDLQDIQAELGKELPYYFWEAIGLDGAYLFHGDDATDNLAVDLLDLALKGDHAEFGRIVSKYMLDRMESVTREKMDKRDYNDGPVTTCDPLETFPSIRTKAA